MLLIRSFFSLLVGDQSWRSFSTGKGAIRRYVFTSKAYLCCRCEYSQTLEGTVSWWPHSCRRVPAVSVHEERQAAIHGNRAF